MEDKYTELKKYYSQAKELERLYDSLGPRIDNVKEIFSYVNIKNPKTLEIGCAYGRDAKIILKYTNNYTGIDFSEEMISLAKKNLPGIDFKVSNMLVDDFPGKYDVIISFASLVHLDKKETKLVLDKAYSSLNNNGIFYISTWYGTYRKRRRKSNFGERIFYHYTEEDYLKLTGSFKIVKIYKNKRNSGDWLNMILKKTA